MPRSRKPHEPAHPPSMTLGTLLHAAAARGDTEEKKTREPSELPREALTFKKNRKSIV